MYRLINSRWWFLIGLLTMTACEKKADVTPAAQQKSAMDIAIGGHPRMMRTDRAGYYGYGEALSDKMLAGWNIDVRPDGQGLPAGEGSVSNGEMLYEEKCAVCHGVFGEGVDRWPQLAGGHGTLTEEKPEKTVGSYWPYATTLWDYIHRAMPFFEPQSLTDNEVYAITAYVLYLNDVVDEEFVANAQTITAVQMPNRDGFFEDPRPDSPNTACMENCRAPKSIRITWDATTMDVTPDNTPDSATELTTAELTTAELQAAPDPGHQSAIDGKTIYQQACTMCHGSGLAGAPAISNTAAWQTRFNKGEAILIEHALKGFKGDSGYMPAKGGHMQLTDEMVVAAVNYILNQAEVKR